MTCAAPAVPKNAKPAGRRVDIGRQIMRERPDWQYLTRRFHPTTGHDDAAWTHLPALFASALTQVGHDWRQARLQVLGAPPPVEPRYPVIREQSPARHGRRPVPGRQAA